MSGSPQAVTSIEVVCIDVPAGHAEPTADHFHVLDLHASGPVQTSICLDDRKIRGTQVRGEINVVPAGATGRWLFATPVSAVLLRLAPAVLQEAADALNLQRIHAELRPAVRTRDPHIEHIGWMLEAEKLAGHPRGRLWAESLAYTIALRLVRRSQHAPDVRPSMRFLPKWRLRNVCDYIEAKLDEDLSLRELAAIAGFSVPHFKVLFRQSVGLSVHRYVVERRVERARQLLLLGRHTMTEIALNVGFAHQSHMTRCVGRVLGISPLQVVGLRRG